MSRSLKIYLALILLLALLTALNVFLPQGEFIAPQAAQEMPAPRPVLALVGALAVLVIYGGLGLLGRFLSLRVGFPDLWDGRVSNRSRFLIPALAGIGLGIFFILVDVALSRLNPYGPLPHPPFPTSLVASLVAGIGEELIFRLFFVSFWVWLLGRVLLKGRWPQVVFWLVAAFSGLAFALGHLPALMILYGFQSPADIPMVLLGEIILLNGVLSLFAADYLRRYGYLAAVGVHFWVDVIWHVIWGLL